MNMRAMHASMNLKLFTLSLPIPFACVPNAGEQKVERLISGGAGLIFKGSGFYITDYRSEGYKEAAKKDKEAASGKKSDKKKSETKKTSDAKSSDTKAA